METILALLLGPLVLWIIYRAWNPRQKPYDPERLFAERDRIERERLAKGRR